MYHRLTKAYLVSQVVFSILVMLFGASYGIRCLVADQIFCAVCFAIIGYVSGYRLLFRASVKELREFNQRHGK